MLHQIEIYFYYTIFLLSIKIIFAHVINESTAELNTSIILKQNYNFHITVIFQSLNCQYDGL